MLRTFKKTLQFYNYHTSIDIVASIKNRTVIQEEIDNKELEVAIFVPYSFKKTDKSD